MVGVANMVSWSNMWEYKLNPNNKNTWTPRNLDRVSLLSLNMIIPQRIFWPEDDTNLTWDQDFQLNPPSPDVWEDWTESRMTECSRKFAYVDTEENTDKLFNRLTKFYKFLHFRKGKDTITTNYMKVWAFESRRRSRLADTLMKTLESGIFQRFQKIMATRVDKRRIEFTKNRTRDVKQGFESVNMSGSIQTVFILWSVLIILGLAIFLMCDFRKEIAISMRSLSQHLVPGIKRMTSSFGANSTYVNSFK
ncbi:uncharacterized protein LOC118439502 [Folsomia candida]|uniref:uncharacterized protein LOC118439502 n=1 Tax=Folsomia candida TaxID=158441 RepID=UPI0016055A88|nr:uncharacterized protein LOC118439502 [Folsomia candida]